MKQKYMDGVRHSAVNSSMKQLNKFGLQMFYTADMENVSYAKDIDCFIVTEQEGDTLLLQSIVCANQVTLSDVLQRMEGNSINAGLDLPLLRMTGICVLQNIIMEVMSTGCFILGRN